MFIFSKHMLWGLPSLLFSGHCGRFPSTVKRPKLEADHSSPTGVDVKNEWSVYLYSPIYFYNVHKDNYTFYSLFFGDFPSSLSPEYRFPGLLDRGYYK